MQVPDDGADMDEEEMAELRDTLEKDYEIGCAPCPPSWQPTVLLSNTQPATELPLRPGLSYVGQAHGCMRALSLQLGDFTRWQRFASIDFI